MSSRIVHCYRGSKPAARLISSRRRRSARSSRDSRSGGGGGGGRPPGGGGGRPPGGVSAPCESPTARPACHWMEGDCLGIDMEVPVADASNTERGPLTATQQAHVMACTACCLQLPHGIIRFSRKCQLQSPYIFQGTSAVTCDLRAWQPRRRTCRHAGGARGGGWRRGAAGAVQARAHGQLAQLALLGLLLLGGQLALHLGAQLHSLPGQDKVLGFSLAASSRCTLARSSTACQVTVTAHSGCRTLCP